MGNVFTKGERGENKTKDTCIAKSLHDILVDRKQPNVLRDLIWKCDSPKVKVLREIFFETGIEEVELLEERVYQYGSLIREQDYIGREIFLGMITLLKEMKQI